jgi:hypothetical protein
MFLLFFRRGRLHETRAKREIGHDLGLLDRRRKCTKLRPHRVSGRLEHRVFVVEETAMVAGEAMGPAVSGHCLGHLERMRNR